jgi:hypothetical protein
MRAHVIWDLWIRQSIVGVRVTVGPAVDGDREHVASSVEATGGQGATHVGADVTFDRVEWRSQNLRASDAILLTSR